MNDAQSPLKIKTGKHKWAVASSLSPLRTTVRVPLLLDNMRYFKAEFMLPDTGPLLESLSGRR